MSKKIAPTGSILWLSLLMIPLFSSLPLRAQETQEAVPPSDAQSSQGGQNATPQTPPGPVQRMTVRGTVLNSATGEPIARALVLIEGDSDSAMLTNGEGHFEFPNLTTGPHVFSVRKPGYSDGSAEAESTGITYDAHQEGEVERNVIVAPEMSELAFGMTPNSAIHGHVELSTGDPAESIVVELVRKNIVNGRPQWSDAATAKTNSSGNFRFSGLSAGIYTLHTLPAKDAQTIESQTNGESTQHLPVSGFPATYFSDARDFSSATLIPLKAGEDAQANLNLALESFQPVLVKIMQAGEGEDGSHGKSSGRELVALTDDNGNPLPYPAAFNQSRREVTANLPDGNYILYLVGMRDSERQDGAGHMRMGSTAFAVEGHPVENLLLATGAMQPVLVHVRLPDSVLRAAGNGRNSELPVFVGFAHANGPAPDMGLDRSPSPDTLSYIPGTAGRYWASATPLHAGACVGSFTAGGADLAREPLVVSPSNPAPTLELTLRDDCARLNLSLPYSASLVMPGVERSYTVYVVPDFDSAATVSPMTLRAGSGTTATLDSLTPGSYHVYTFTSPIAFEYHNPSVLAQLTGQAVTLAPSSTQDLMLEVPEK